MELHYNSVYNLINTYRCSHCQRIFDSLTALKRHNNTYSSVPFIYPCCKKLFLWKAKSFQHSCDIKRNLNENVICGNELDTCDNNSSFSSDDIAINTQSFKCNNCDAIFSRYQSVKAHILKYPGYHNFNCVKCKKSFFTASLLQKHLCLLSNITFRCSCLEQFDSLKKFKAHVGFKRPYFCCTCQNKCATFNNLINHIRSHTKESPYLCPICNRSFRVRGSLTLHLKLHEGEKPFHCSKCSYSTSRKWNLHLHEKIHNPKRNQERQYLCAECGSSFLMKHHLRRHMEIHNLENSQLCLKCGKLFNQKSYLEKHMVTHKKDSELGQRCTVCLTDLQREEIYQHHIETGHYKHVCHPCKKVFLTKFNLKRHLESHKNIK